MPLPDIDSSGWAADPRTHGMSAAEYIQAESRRFFADFVGRAGINRFHHFTALATAQDHWVVSPNNDTLYSIAVANVTRGFTLEVPEAGDRFVSVQIIDENHITPFYLYGGGSRDFAAVRFDTDYVAVGIRIGTDGTTGDVAHVVERLQPQCRIVGAADIDALVRPDPDLTGAVRTALIAEYAKMGSTEGIMQSSADLVTDWERFTYATAGAWGLSADENAMYKPYALKGAVGGRCYLATFPPVPARAFFSITAYGPDNYLMSNEDNSISSNRGVATNADGSFTVAFGGPDCRDRAPNFVLTPKDGWNYLLRAYRPDVEAFRAYALPELVPLD